MWTSSAAGKRTGIERNKGPVQIHIPLHIRNGSLTTAKRPCQSLIRSSQTLALTYVSRLFTKKDLHGLSLPGRLAVFPSSFFKTSHDLSSSSACGECTCSTGILLSTNANGLSVPYRKHEARKPVAAGLPDRRRSSKHQTRQANGLRASGEVQGALNYRK